MKELKQISNFNVNVRPGDVDESVVTEVLAGKMGYEKHFPIEPDEHRIDLGGHIGSFALLCHLRCSRALVSVEPAPDNFKLLEENLRINNVPTVPLEAAVVGNDQTVLPLYLHEQKPKVTGTTTQPIIRSSTTSPPTARPTRLKSNASTSTIFSANALLSAQFA